MSLVNQNSLDSPQLAYISIKKRCLSISQNEPLQTTIVILHFSLFIVGIKDPK